jgi:hypothetical protein
MELQQDRGETNPSQGGDRQNTYRIVNNVGLEPRSQRVAPVIQPSPLSPFPTQGFPWAFPDPRGYSDHESITSSSGSGSFASSSLDRKQGLIF